MNRSPYEVLPLIVSSRAAAGDRTDAVAPVVAELAEAIGFGCRQPVIAADGGPTGEALRQALQQDPPAVILTCGGTGPSPDDLTPEQTAPLVQRELPGVMEALRDHGRRATALASLGRGIAGISGSTVIINLPGSPRAVRESGQVLQELLPHLCEQAAGRRSGHIWGAQSTPSLQSSAPTPDPSPAQAPVSVQSSEIRDRVIWARISDEPVDPAAAESAVWSQQAGAVVAFSGIVRNHDGGQGVSRLSYSAHPSAEDALRATAGSIAAEHPEVRIWVCHRIGSLEVGDHALVAACASAHRAEAFAACAALVERVKAEVPIWKEQFFLDGSKEWVGL